MKEELQGSLSLRNKFISEEESSKVEEETDESINECMENEGNEWAKELVFILEKDKDEGLGSS